MTVDNKVAKVRENCLFYTDGEAESEDAKNILDQYNIIYQTIDLRLFNSTDVSPPRLVSSLGRFNGIERIIEYAKQFGHEDE